MNENFCGIDNDDYKGVADCCCSCPEKCCACRGCDLYHGTHSRNLGKKRYRFRLIIS